MFIILLGEVATNVSTLSLFLRIGTGALLSIPISYFILPKVRDKLVKGQSSFLDRRPPGASGFFLLLGVVGGFLAFIIDYISNTQILSALLLVCLSVLISSFTIIGIYVLLLERRHKKKAYLRMPDGLVFLDQKGDH
jgi:hypothetical protein